MVARDNLSPWQPTFAPGSTCARCGTVTPYDETRVVGTLHLHSWRSCDCRTRGKRILTIQRSGPAFAPPLLPATCATSVAERHAYAVAWNRRANRAEAVNAAGMAHVMPPGAVVVTEPPVGVGHNWIWQADALELLGRLRSGSIDMILTSPPYDQLRAYKGYSWDFEGIAREMYRVLKTGGVAVWIVGDSVVDGSETLSSFEQALYFKKTVGFRLHDTMIWHKDGSPFPESNRYLQTFEYMFVLSKDAPRVCNQVKEPTKYGASRACSGRDTDGSIERFKYELKKPTRTLDNIWYVPSGFMKTTKDNFAFEHPAMFPEELARRHILTWSNPGDLVLDFFMGSGTTAKMTALTGRHYIGSDIAAEYVALSRRRVANVEAQPTLIPFVASSAVQTAFAFAAP